MMKPATMIPKMPDDPGCDAWRNLDETDLTAEQQQRRELHLDSCPSCQWHIDQAVAAEADFLRRGRHLGDPTQAPVDPTLVQTLERLIDDTTLEAPAPLPDLYFLKPSDRPDLLGTLRGYEVQEIIGHGGMGIVLKAYELSLGRRVAIKLLATPLAGSATARLRFTREARAAAAVRHENIVAVYCVDELEGLPYFVMEYIPGESLQDRLDRTGPLPVSEIIQLGLQAASALAAAHAQGLIHRDIKPANILLQQGTGHVKITDFGLARAVDDVTATQPGVVAGTPEFMAPEQARAERVDERADLFSLGSVLYAACTATAPFGGTTTLGVLRQVSEQTPTAIRTLNHDIPAWLETLINRLMAKDPDRRIQTAAKVIELLQAGAQGNRPRLSHKKRILYGAMGILLALLPILFIVLAQPATMPSPRATPIESYHDFRGQALPASMNLFGDPECVRFEPEGLRITLPKDRQDLGPVGIATNLDLTGDFEITTTFELLEAESPPPSYGVGLTLVVRKPPPAGGSAAIGRLVRHKDRQLVVWDQSFGELNGKPRTETGSFPITDMVGRLRLKRTGASLHYAWAPGVSGDRFKALYRCDFGHEPICRITVSGVTGRMLCALDARILDLRISAAQAADLPAAPSPFASTSGSQRGWLALGVLTVLVTTFCLAAWQARRTSKRAASSPSGSGPSTALVSCSRCSKSFKIKAKAVGKKLKCPDCGHVMGVTDRA
jgi:serine/threonine protein kinase